MLSLMQQPSSQTLIETAYSQLYEKPSCPYATTITYSNRFKPYGANIRYSRSELRLHLSAHWKDVSDDILIGLIQELLLKVWKKKPYPETIPLQLYHGFIRGIPDCVPKDSVDPVLEKRFCSINETFFLNQLEMPNLRWGRFSRRRFGSYNFKTDTITISPVLQSVEAEVLDYVLFHEMLHKLHKFEIASGKARYHTKKFRYLEQQFPNATKIETILQRIADNKYPLDTSLFRTHERHTARIASCTKNVSRKKKLFGFTFSKE
jgi:hypothetical protein